MPNMKEFGVILLEFWPSTVNVHIQTTLLHRIW